MENGLSLATITRLLTVITTLTYLTIKENKWETFKRYQRLVTLDDQGRLASLVLGDLVGGVLLALASAKSTTGLGNVHLNGEEEIIIRMDGWGA